MEEKNTYESCCSSIDVTTCVSMDLTNPPISPHKKMHDHELLVFVYDQADQVADPRVVHVVKMLQKYADGQSPPTRGTPNSR